MNKWSDRETKSSVGCLIVSAGFLHISKMRRLLTHNTRTRKGFEPAGWSAFLRAPVLVYG
jgi:hypothetical protein